MDLIRRAMVWRGPVEREFITVMAGVRKGTSFDRLALEDPVAWAWGVMGFDVAVAGGDDAGPAARDVVRRYRTLLREAHPDHGARSDGAAQRIADLTEARRILTGR
jgi:hypothetical protein